MLASAGHVWRLFAMQCMRPGNDDRKNTVLKQAQKWEMIAADISGQ